MSITATSRMNVVQLLTLSLAALAAIVAILIYVGGGDSNSIDWPERAERAAQLQNNKLYEAAIADLQPLVDQRSIPRPKRAGYAFTIAEMYHNELRDFENAAAWYIRARALDPPAGLNQRIGRQLVECFENLGRSFDAARQLADYTTVDSTGKAMPGEVVVAKIGEREITLSEIEQQLQKLPPQVQQEFVTPEKKLEFVRQYIGMELLYQSALRRGLDREPQIAQQITDLSRQVILDEMLAREVVAAIQPTDADLRTFYQAHKTDMFQDKEYDEVKNQVEVEFRRMKNHEKYLEVINNLITAEPVTVYEERIK